MLDKRKGTTAKDVALACNTSQAAVSYAINNKAGSHISAAKRIEILETAKKMHYFPNASAKNMRRKENMSIGLVSGNNYKNSGFSEALFGIKQYLGSIGYTITILSDTADPQQQECVKYYHSNLIEGIIFISFDSQFFHLQAIEEHRIPYVIISENGVACPKTGAKHAFEDVVKDCVRFCKNNDLQSIRYFTIQVKDRLYHNKYDIVKKAIDEIYPKCDFKRIICPTNEDGDKEISAILEGYLQENVFDIAISPNARIGILMQNCILKNNFVVPQSVKHICLASSPFFTTIYPSISSLKIPLLDMGSYAAELLISLVRDIPIEDRDFKCTLVHGVSTMLDK